MKATKIIGASLALACTFGLLAGSMVTSAEAQTYYNAQGSSVKSPIHHAGEYTADEGLAAGTFYTRGGFDLRSSSVKSPIHHPYNY